VDMEIGLQHTTQPFTIPAAGRVAATVRLESVKTRVSQ
jgi:hypothetical protein